MGTWLHIQDVAILPRLIYTAEEQGQPRTHSGTTIHVVNNVPNLSTTGLTHAHPSYREQWAISSARLKMQMRPRNHLLARDRQHGLGVNAFRGSKVAGNMILGG